LNSGIEPVILILGVLIEWTEEAFVEKVAELCTDGGVVHHIPKLAIDLYMYFAGLVKDNVGVAWCKKHI
jgi:hypothetical protein